MGQMDSYNIIYSKREDWKLVSGQDHDFGIYSIPKSINLIQSTRHTTLIVLYAIMFYLL